MIDSHIHIGQFYSEYYSPKEVFIALKDNGIDRFIFSSTSSCIQDVDYKIIENEIKIIYTECNASPEKVKPIFWVIPNMFFKKGFDPVLFKELPYCGFKIHPKAQNWDFLDAQIVKLANQIFDYAATNNLPVLIHTGYDAIDEASKFERFFDRYSDVTFILAHGRPIAQTIEMLTKYKNVFVDTAFMPIKSIDRILQVGLSSKIIFGTDFPITSYFFKESNLKKQYKEDISLKTKLPDKIFQILQSNTQEIWFLNSH